MGLVPHREHLATDDAPLHFAKLSFDRSSAQHYEVRKLLSNTDGSDTKQEAEAMYWEAMSIDIMEI
eukprot:4295523-Amphidinium_carterae.1